jgi:hypothetical protein
MCGVSAPLAVVEPRPRIGSGAVACFAVLLAFGWQLFTVTRNYHGDWTALYCIGGARPLPPPLRDAYRFRGSTGFDGQAYLMIALDPLFRNDHSSYVDEAALRYRRILLPGLAFITGLGDPRLIVYTYILVNLGFLFLGTWWMSELTAVQFGHPAWGLLFLAVPSVPISLDRQTVDMALTALVLGAAYAWRTERWPLLFLLLPLVSLARETGVLVVGGFILAFLLQRQWKRAAWCLAGMAPFLAWSWWGGLHLPLLLREWLPVHPYAASMHTLLHPPVLPFSDTIRFLVECFDLAALAGFVLGVMLSVRTCMRARAYSGPMLSSLLIAGLCAYLFSLDEWMHVYDYGRIASPMAALIIAERASFGRLCCLPAILMTCRVIVQIAPQVFSFAGVHL